MDPAVFELHGNRFDAYVRPAAGSTQLCAWRLTVPAALDGTSHRPDREEVLLGLSGELAVTVDDHTHRLVPGEVVLVPAAARLRVSGGPDGGSAWVTTTVGLRATTDDGAVLAPPWCG
ncbi:Cupin domain-containing protein [Jatrophihabitans endophyticus]|uniref:Cupin domain-containing protein n=2 Tax=Jatrophihabitans endophyticus TaxID=1206085 RepID=A0A1M5T677_9ACTN|nr:Cupin domain-containing protein [Jatrophihabitans endophyticus]